MTNDVNSDGRRHTMRAGALSVAVALMLALTGCGPVDAGTSAAEAFERDFADVDGVASVDAGGHNNLPFSGSVDAHVTADPDLSDVQVDRLAATFSEYMRTHSANVSWNASVTFGGMTVGVGEDDDFGVLNIEVARELIATPHVQLVEVGLIYSDEKVLVAVDSPDALADGYGAAAAAVQRLGITDGRSNAHAISTPAGFEIDDESWDGEATRITPALTLFQLLLERFALIGAEVTPAELSVRTAGEDDVPAVEAFLAGIPLPADLVVDVQGGATTIDGATQAARAVAEAIADLEVSAEIHASENYVNVTVPTAADADSVLAAVGDLPEFSDVSGFGIRTETQDFRVFDRPADFADSLAIARAALALPGVDKIEISRPDADDQEPTARFEFADSDEATISAFATTMKPLLIERGWHTWINAAGSVEWFTAADPLVLDDRVSGKRDAEEQEFADMLVRLWDAAAG
ncbi:MAG: hypothetical protein JF592_09065 [Microbacterium sp.]|uniref:hypothetical protein n=1 Tax=Microbacterium sp. TaxID=51671 RepID=UPI001DD58706|nr:hypothetical protein [Microbacterium sp.]MBW8762718.1 hypothetical protein [Microbacterium sp.]